MFVVLFIVTACLAALVSTQEIGLDRTVLVLLEQLDYKRTHSQFFHSLSGISLSRLCYVVFLNTIHPIIIFIF
jgi:hypothetical protein